MAPVMPETSKTETIELPTASVWSTRLLDADALRAEAANWNALWAASDLHSPTLRAEPLLKYLAQFHSRDEFCAVIVEGECGWQAALPLVLSRRWFGRMAMLPNSPWMSCGELLVNANRDPRPALQQLATRLRSLSANVIQLDWIRGGRAAWQELLNCCQANGQSWTIAPKFHSGRIDVDQPWDQFQRRYSKNRRKQMRRNLEGLQSLGGLRLERIEATDEPRFRPALQKAWDIEDRSWKGEHTSSIRANGLVVFFEEMAVELGRHGLCELHLLSLDDRPIAFDFGFFSKGVYASHKVGFDPQFADYSPGHVLMHLTLKEMCDDPSYREVDTVGELTEAVARWCTDDYLLEWVTLVPQPVWGGLAIRVLRAARSLRSWWRADRRETHTGPQPVLSGD